jgi:hypothetical protein
MADDKKEPWLNLLALTTVLLAVCATLATFKGGGYSTRAVLSQSQASDQWAYYQAKGIKGILYEVEAQRLEREARTASPALAPGLQHDLAEAQKRVQRYQTEQAEIQKEARRLEDAKAEAQKHSGAFGFAVIFLQIAILLSSVAALLKQKYVYWLGLAVGVVGVVCFVNGFLLFLPL